MKIKITDDCINCGVCETECPAGAVYPRIENTFRNGALFINNKVFLNKFSSTEHFYINPYECTKCTGIYNQPWCNVVCPVACCLDEDIEDSYRTTEKTNLVLFNKISLN